jgi:hypothetical protein
MRLEPHACTRLDQQRLEHVLDSLRRAEQLLYACSAAPARDEGEVTGACVARSFAVDHDRNARREVRLADEQLAPPSKLDDDWF